MRFESNAWSDEAQASEVSSVRINDKVEARSAVRVTQSGPCYVTETNSFWN